MSDFRDKYIKCPFFLTQVSRKIHCEGFDKGNHIHVQFDNTELADAHREKFCSQIYAHRTCPIYQIAARKYYKED